MAYYAYYNSQPTWGTQQYQYVAPPMPEYQPQPSWHGADYYRAHSNSPDNSLFNYVWSKVKTLSGGAGVGRSEATHWWKRVYGGHVKPHKLVPHEIGAAAGYEAIRCWEHHKTIYVQPLSEDRDREREALIGLATAEAARLWSYTRRPLDKYGRMEASEVAAATAAHIFSQSYDYGLPYDEYERSPRSRRRSGSRNRSGYSGNEYYGNDYGMLDGRPHTDYLDAYPRHSRSRSRSRSLSQYRSVLPHRSSSAYRRSPSPVAFGRRSPSPVAMGGLGVDPAVGLSSAAVTSYPGQYAVGAGIPGTYYPPVAGSSPYYSHSPSGYSGYQQLPSSYAVDASPYGNPMYAGSSVGLPPPPTGNYLSAPATMGHHRSRSTGSYGAVRPSFGY